ncbi:MAG: YicC/YloC family endoribonuclease [Pseudomonadota bacterium]
MPTNSSPVFSMTAFARNTQLVNGGQIILEFKSVNSRFLETNFRLPESIRHLELELREKIRKKLKRGKVDCFVKLSIEESESNQLSLNLNLLRQLVNVESQIINTFPKAKNLDASDIVKWPGVVQSEESDLSQIEATLLTMVDEALDELLAVREREGKELSHLIMQRVAEIVQQVAEVKKIAPEIIKWQREKLIEKFEQAKLDLEPDRLEQEMVMFAQKIDVAEEMDRLAAHCKEVEHILSKGGAVGRRLDFVMQELNREANTLGSKSVNSQTTAAAVDIKVLIEQMREQIQNIE